MTKPKTTLIVNYKTSQDKNNFKAENTGVLGDYKIIWVNNFDVSGIRVDILPELDF